MQRPCQCDPDAYPIWCERHQVHKTAGWVRLCRSDDAYWRAWEEGWGPGQRSEATERRAVPARHAGGPGTELKRILLAFGIKAASGCNCAGMARQMDGWGPGGCEKRLEKIVDHLEKEAKRRKLPIPFRRTLARLLVRRAIRLARKRGVAT